MKRMRMLICLVLIGLMIPGIIRLWGRLPSDTAPLIEKKYGDWAGVLRLWVLEGWPTGKGGVAVWLNACIRRYEKAHPGVYVQPEYVDAPTLRALGCDGLLPPDLVLFPPGALETADALLPLDGDYPLRPGLDRSERAVPVLLGGYMWAYNTSLLDRLPSDWRGAEVAPAVLPDGPWRHWSAALLALCSEQPPTDAPDAGDERLGAVELGLPDEPVPTPAPSQQAAAPCRLPEGFAAHEDAWRSFLNGDAAAMPVTQREIRRLQALSDQGQGVDWALTGGGHAFTDQALYLGVVNTPAPADKLKLCHALVDHLLSDESQGALHRCGAFAVTNASSGYTAADPLSAMDALLRNNVPLTPGPFAADWWRSAEPIVRMFFENAPDPAALWPQFIDCLY